MQGNDLDTPTSLTGDGYSFRGVPCVKTHTEAVRGLCELTDFV